MTAFPHFREAIRMQKIQPILILSTSPSPKHLKKGAYVRVTKLRAAEGGMPACPRPIYSPGLWKDILSLPTGYWMEGVLLADVVKHGAILLRRQVRDGVKAMGVFRSTRVCSIEESEVTTYNSVYLIEEVTPFIPGLLS
jgi:hypothetical protein